MQKPPKTRAEAAAYIIEQIEERGIKVHPSSRLMQMKRVLDRGYIDFENIDFLVALESIRDMYQLRLILEESSMATTGEFKACLRKLLQDESLPQDGNSHTPGRNTQFEMYLAAIASRAGLQPIEYAEPDVICRINGARFRAYPITEPFFLFIV